jgi:hypothetical protein
MTKFLRLSVLFLTTCSFAVADTTIFWNSPQGAANVTSNGITPMDASFRFELGVFNPGFVPASGNISQWAENWNPAQRTAYQADIKRYTDIFIATGNASPFTAGSPMYVWGFKGDPLAGEWILFRAAGWTWPTVPPVPAFLTWDAKDATAVIGTINATGSPFLMKSAAVANLPPPKTSYSQWVADELSGETLVAAHEDADGDGNANVFEFMAGTPPKVAGAPIPFGYSLVESSGSYYNQLSVLRRIDRPVSLTFQVSGDLDPNTWVSGAGNTTQVSSTNTSVVVRDLTPVSPGSPRRFIRVSATAP